MSQLILSCEKTGRAFNSGFEVTCDDLRFVPPNWTARFFCRSCAKVHDFSLAKARVCECPHKCPTYGDCQGCEFSKPISGKAAAQEQTLQTNASEHPPVSLPCRSKII